MSPTRIRISSQRRLGVLLCDPASAPGLRSSRRLKVLSRTEASVSARFANLFVVCSATELPAVAAIASAANRQHRLRGLFVRENVEPGFLGPMLDRARIRLWRNVLVHHGPPVPERILRAWETEAEDQLIAEAAVSAGRLSVLTCALERLDIPISAVRPLARLSETHLREFEVAEDGSYVHWRSRDVHLDLEALRCVIDPAARTRAEIERASHDARFGHAVAALRQAQGLTQSGIAGVSERQVRRIEAGAVPTVATLRRLAQAHGLELAAYLDRISRKAAELAQAKPA